MIVYCSTRDTSLRDFYIMTFVISDKFKLNVFFNKTQILVPRQTVATSHYIEVAQGGVSSRVIHKN